MTYQEILDNITTSKFLGFIDIYENYYPVFRLKDKKKVIVIPKGGRDEIDVHRFLDERANRGSDWPGRADAIKSDYSLLVWGKEVRIDATRKGNVAEMNIK